MKTMKKFQAMNLLLGLILVQIVHLDLQSDNLEERVKMLDQQFETELDSNINWLNQLKTALKQKMEDPNVQNNYEHYQLLESKENKINQKINELQQKKKDLAQQPTDLEDYYKLNEFRDRTIDISDIQNDEELKLLIKELPKKSAKVETHPQVQVAQQKVSDFGSDENPFEQIASQVQAVNTKNTKQNQNQPNQKQNDQSQNQQKNKEDDEQKEQEKDQDSQTQNNQDDDALQKEKDQNLIQTLDFKKQDSDLESITNQVPVFKYAAGESKQKNLDDETTSIVEESSQQQNEVKKEEQKQNQELILQQKYKLEKPSQKEIDTSSLDEYEKQKAEKINKEYKIKEEEIEKNYDESLKVFVKEQQNLDEQSLKYKQQEQQIHTKYSKFLDENFGEEIKSNHVFINGEANGQIQNDETQEKKKIKVKKEVFVMNQQEIQKVNELVQTEEKRITPKKGINISVPINDEQTTQVQELTEEEKNLLQKEKQRIKALKNDPDFQNAMLKISHTNNKINKNELQKKKQTINMNKLQNQTYEELVMLEGERQDKIFSLFDEQEQNKLRQKNADEIQIELQKLKNKKQQQQNKDNALQDLKNQALGQRTQNQKMVYPDDADLYNVFQIEKPEDLINLAQSYNIDIDKRRLKQDYQKRLSELIDFDNLKNEAKSISNKTVEGIKNFIENIKDYSANLFSEEKNTEEKTSSNNANDQNQQQTDIDDKEVETQDNNSKLFDNIIGNNQNEVYSYQINDDPDDQIVYEIQFSIPNDELNQENLDDENPQSTENNSNGLNGNYIEYSSSDETPQEKEFIDNMMKELEDQIKQDEQWLIQTNEQFDIPQIRSLQVKKGRPYLVFTQKTKNRIQNLLLNIDECIQNKDIKKNATGIIDIIQKNLYELKSGEAKNIAQEIDEVKNLLIEGRAIDQDKTKDYLKKLESKINTLIYEAMKKKNVTNDTKNLLYYQNVLKNLITQTTQRDIGKGILLEDFQNLFKVMEMKLSTVIGNLKQVKNVSQTDEQFLLKRIKDKMQKDIEESDPQKNEVVIESVAQNLDAFINNEINSDYQSIQPEKYMEDFIDKSIQKLENIKDSQSQSGYKITTQELEGLVDDMIKEIKNEENQKFKKRLDSLHFILLKIDNDLSKMNIPNLQRQNMISVIYKEFENFYEQILKSTKEISNSSSSLDQAQFVQNPENKPYYQGFKQYADKVIDYQKNFKRIFRSNSIDDFLQDLFNLNNNVSPQRRLVNRILFDFEKNKHHMKNKDKLSYFIVAHYIQNQSKKTQRNLKYNQHKQAVMTILDKDDKNKKKMLVIKN